MRVCPQCHNKTLTLKNIFTLKYRCSSCNALCTSSTAHKAVANILVNVLPIVGIILGIAFKSAVLFFIGAIIIPITLCWWHQKKAALVQVAQ